MSVKPAAWMRGGQPYLEPAGVTYEVPLYSAPAPELAEALAQLLNTSRGPMRYHPDAPGYQAAKDTAISLLARITPK